MEIGLTVRPSRLLYSIYSDSLWRFTDEKVRLTFDDGPGPITENILNWLYKNKIKGYFFLLPDQVAKDPALAKTILDSGHQVGVHFNHHKPYWLESKSAFINDLETARKRLEDHIHHQVDICRAPYGRIMPWQEKWIFQSGLKHWFWSCSSKDYRNENKKVVIERLKKYLFPGDIVLFHDGYKYSEHITEILGSLLDLEIELEHLTSL